MSFQDNTASIKNKIEIDIRSKNPYATGQVNINIPEIEAFAVEEEEETELFGPPLDDDFKNLPCIQKTENMKVYYDVIFCNLLGCMLLSKFQDQQKMSDSKAKDGFQRFVNQNLMQDPAAFG